MVVFYKNQVLLCNRLVKYTKIKEFQKKVVFSKKCGIIHVTITCNVRCDRPWQGDICACLIHFYRIMPALIQTYE